VMSGSSAERVVAADLFGNLVARMAAWCHTEPDDLCRPAQGPTAGRRPGSACGRTSCHNATPGLVLRAVDRTKGNVNECWPGAAEELQDDSPYYL
jgi:hypothetical protein